MSIQRDYKPASAWQRRRRAVRRHGLLVITLILIGLFGGLLAYIKGDRHQQAPATAAIPSAAPVQPARATATAPAPKVIVPEPAPAPVKPKYDFYTELPKRQVDIQQEEINPRATPPSQPPPRTQPANEPLRKPAAPQKSATPPTVAALSVGIRSMARPDSADPPHGVQSARPLANRPGIAVKTQ